MKSEGALKHLLGVFLLVTIGYTVLYVVIEQRRATKGPWEVTFTQTPTGNAAIIIDQPRLGISKVQIAFEGQAVPGTNELGPFRFREARPVPFNLPFGKCVFLDTTFLPGTVTMQLFQHEIELLPRVLVIDRGERKWVADSLITLAPKPAM